MSCFNIILFYTCIKFINSWTSSQLRTLPTRKIMDKAAIIDNPALIDPLVQPLETFLQST